MSGLVKYKFNTGPGYKVENYYLAADVDAAVKDIKAVEQELAAGYPGIKAHDMLKRILARLEGK